ncbi:hypothetical protein [Gracilimonas mengyeensis]|uniref:Uncharacterized protein n=1 Tax=Gracilimonas mengyeensis TaxID=1302730 RepID=A0A521EE13_9BACT|nr:hypothetical protein [Gracilimonas mengyeensis]SMO82072.1 hypothetical protein SAMN06265219_111127 [Gracilimonas mengyeensis]
MSGYSEVLYVMFAMIIVSTMALNANRVIQVNNVSMVEGQLESQVVAYAQNIIEEARAHAFDEKTRYDTGGNSIVPVNIPDGFSDIGTDGETGRNSFNDFDDFDNHTETLTLGGVDYELSVNVEYVTTLDYATYSTAVGKSTLKRITVNIKSGFLKKNNSADTEPTNYNFSFIRSYYAD